MLDEIFEDFEEGKFPPCDSGGAPRRVMLGVRSSRPAKCREWTLVITPPEPIALESLIVSRGRNLLVLSVQVGRRALLYHAVPGACFDPREGDAFFGGNIFARIALVPSEPLCVTLRRLPAREQDEQAEIVVRRRARGGLRVVSRPRGRPSDWLPRRGRIECVVSGWTI